MDSSLLNTIIQQNSMKEIQCSMYIVKWQQVARELIKTRERASFVRSFLLYSPVLSARGDVKA